MAVRPRRKYRVTPLREAQRQETRRRIRDAARELFYAGHYETTTMDEIAGAAGLRRSTVYLHYKDKTEIIADILHEYMPRLTAVIATFPGPGPTVEQIVRWMESLSGFFEAERVPISIVLDASPFQQRWPVLAELTHNVLAALGTNNVMFRRAAEPGGDLKLRAHAILLVTQLTLISQPARETDGQDARSAKFGEWLAALRLAVAEAFHDFVHRDAGDHATSRHPGRSAAPGSGRWPARG